MAQLQLVPSSRLAPIISTAYVMQVVPPNNLQREALAMENLLQSFSLNEPFSLELCGEPHRQRFLLRASSEAALETLCQQLLAQYPQVQFRRVSAFEDPLVVGHDEYAQVGDFALRAPSWMPIKTFWNEEMTQEGTDPVLGLLTAIEPVKEGERVVCQIALTSAPDSWMQKHKRKALENPLDKEQKMLLEERKSVATTQSPFLREMYIYLLLIVGAAVSLQGYTWYRIHAWLQLGMLCSAVFAVACSVLWWWLQHSITLYDPKLVSEKLMRVAFFAHVRVIVIGKTTVEEKRLRMHMNRVEVSYRQYNLANSNGFHLKRTQFMHGGSTQANSLFKPKYSLPYHTLLSRLIHQGWSKTILNAREVSGMWHLPQTEAEAPLVERLATKRILAQPEIFQRIQRTEAVFPPVLAGYSVHHGLSVPVYLPEEALFSHKFVIAKSGYGKSTLMQLLACGAMQPVPSGVERPQPGVVVVDPHGDLIDDLLRQIPPERVADVLLVDLADEKYPVGINLLDATMGFTSDQAIANMMSSFQRIWGESWGPRLAYVLKHVLKTLYTINEQLVAQGKEDEQYTLLDVLPLLQQTKYARKVLAVLDKDDLQHQKELSWWNDYYFKLPPSFQQEVISPVSNKIGIFNDNRVLERIVGQSQTSMGVNSSVTAGKIILVNLASGRLEFDAAAIIGATILNLVHRTLQMQASVPFALRRQVFVAVDEFQNIPGADYEALLSEDRKYGGSLMLATQSLVRLEQMKEGLEAITFSNCAQLFAFSTSAEDAEKLGKELHEQVTVPYLLNQPRLSCYARLTLPEQPLQIFSMQLAKPEGWNRSLENEEKAEKIRASNRERYLSRAAVDEQLKAQAQRAIELSASTENAKETKKTPSMPIYAQKPTMTGGEPPQPGPATKETALLAESTLTQRPSFIDELALELATPAPLYEQHPHISPSSEEDKQALQALTPAAQSKQVKHRQAEKPADKPQQRTRSHPRSKREKKDLE